MQVLLTLREHSDSLSPPPSPVFCGIRVARPFSFMRCVFNFVCLRSVSCAKCYLCLWINHIATFFTRQEIDLQRFLSRSFVCSVSWSERWLFVWLILVELVTMLSFILVWLILVELVTITVKLYSHNCLPLRLSPTIAYKVNIIKYLHNTYCTQMGFCGTLNR